ncbi:MAG: YchJ family metal-binding protein [Burkholderiales bacterium]|nr:YchJ family metal-binding protein [Burkholderiales bacterium]
MDLKSTSCKCGSNKDYKDCCGLYISGLKLPHLPEQLMRSRYTAYSVRNIDYIAKSMCGKAITGFNIKEAEIWAQQVIWQKLEIIATSLASKTKGFVEFKAYFTDNQQPHILHEISEFHFKNGKWFYVDGVIF